MPAFIIKNSKDLVGFGFPEREGCCIRPRGISPSIPIPIPLASLHNPPWDRGRWYEYRHEWGRTLGKQKKKNGVSGVQLQQLFQVFQILIHIHRRRQCFLIIIMVLF
eukprot:Gb_24049 [translate_table: standard]